MNYVRYKNVIRAIERDDLDEVKRLIKVGNVDVNMAGQDGRTPLFAATESDHVEIAEYLIAKGAKVNAADEKYGYTPLHAAASRGRTKVVQFLVERDLFKGYAPSLCLQRLSD